jgi:hypothetical protein
MSNGYGYKDIIEILMKRDDMTRNEAENLFEEAQREFDMLLANGETSLAENICKEWFGLEPDYLEAFL